MKSTIIASSRLWINVAVYIFLVALNDLDAVNFSIENQEISDDAVTVTVPIKVSDFSDVGAMQFTLRWDSTVLNFKNLGDFDHSADPSELFFFSATNFNTDGVANGTLLCLYEQLFATDAVLEDNVTIFSITFDVIGGDGISTVVGFSDDPTPRKLASFLVQSPDFISQDGTIQIGSGSLSSDSTAPIITLNGAAIVNQEAGSIYADAGASATDDTDASVTVLAAGTVDVAAPGTYTLTYNASDAAGNAATPVTRTVKVVDVVTFIIQDQTLAGDARVTVPVKVSSFAHVGGMQFTLTWDPSVLTFSSLGDFNHSTENTELFFFGETNFNLAQVANGKLPVLYEHVLTNVPGVRRPAEEHSSDCSPPRVWPSW